MKKRRAGGTGVFLRMELFAAVRIGATQHQIRLVSLAGQPAREITVKDWNNFMSLDWAADGKGFFISSNPTVRLDTVLYVDLAGTATPLWQVKNFQAAWRFLRTKESTWPFRRLRRSAMFGWLKILEATRLSAPARVDLRGGPPERLEPACGCTRQPVLLIRMASLV